MKLCSLVLLSSAVLIGCGPTRTSATKGLAKKDLAVLEVKQHTAIPGFHINKIAFDGEEFDINGNRMFYLTPGQHKMAIGYGVCIHGPQAWFSPMGDWALYTPRGDVTGDLMAGGRYQLRGWAEGSGSLARHLHDIVNADWKPPVD